MNNYLRRKNELSPFDESNWFKDFFQMPFLSKENYLKTDIVESNQGYTMIMDIPGTKKEEVKISSEDGYLTVEVNHSCSTHNTSKNYIKKERMHESYSRSYYIGNNVNPDQISASFHDGVLEISFPKAKQESTSKYIPIK